MKPRYNIIWIDDEWDKMTQFKNECEVIHNIYLHPFRTQKAGMEALDGNLSKWDAVVLDAKMFDQSEINETANLVGLGKAINHLNQLPAGRRIPYFISTGQPDLMDNESFEQFIGKYYIKEKDDLQLINDIKETVAQSTRFQIREIYCDHYEQLLQLSPEACDDIMTILETMHFPDSHPDFTPRYFFNPVRKALEYVFRSTQKVGIIPDDFFKGNIVNLNQCFMFLIGKEAEKLGYRHKDGGITPRHIQDMMSLIINLGNANSHSFEASHSTELSDIEILDFDNHIKTIGGNSKLLVFSIALQFCEILQWMNNYIKEHPTKDENIKQWMRTNENNSDEKIGIAGTINNDKVYLLDSKGSYIIDKKEGFMPNYSPKQYNYSLNEKVIFDLKETINPKNNSPFLFAINIRPARYE